MPSLNCVSLPKLKFQLVLSVVSNVFAVKALLTWFVAEISEARGGLVGGVGVGGWGLGRWLGGISWYDSRNDRWSNDNQFWVTCRVNSNTEKQVTPWKLTNVFCPLSTSLLC